MSVRGSFKIWGWFLEESIIALIMYYCKIKQQLFYCFCTFTGLRCVVLLLCVIWARTAVIWGLDWTGTLYVVHWLDRQWWPLEGWSWLECWDNWASLSPDGLRISSSPHGLHMGSLCGSSIKTTILTQGLRPPIEYKSRNCLMFLRQYHSTICFFVVVKMSHRTSSFLMWKGITQGKRYKEVWFVKNHY